MILPYVIKSAMALALLYTCIIPLLEKETFHRLNRILILGCLIMSFAIPLVHFTGGTNPTVDMVRQTVQLPEVLINGDASEQSIWSWADIMICIYNRCRSNILYDSCSDRASDKAAAPVRAYHRQQRQHHCSHRLCHKSVLSIPLHCDEPRRLCQQPQFHTDT